MNADDRHHGTTARYRAGCRCDLCRAANTRYDKGRRLDELRGQPRTIDATGTRRRVEALHAIGWSLHHIADRAGYNTLQAINRATRRRRVTVATAARIAAVYDELCMTPGPSRASRRRAERMGYAPPLAWDDIDTDEQPTGHVTALTAAEARTTHRAETLADLHQRGAGISEACRVLGVSREAVEKWCARHDRRDLYAALVGREHVGSSNKWTTERSA